MIIYRSAAIHKDHNHSTLKYELVRRNKDKLNLLFAKWPDWEEKLLKGEVLMAGYAYWKITGWDLIKVPGYDNDTLRKLNHPKMLPGQFEIFQFLQETYVILAITEDWEEGWIMADKDGEIWLSSRCPIAKKADYWERQDDVCLVGNTDITHWDSSLTRLR